jgi:hypothetical protein
MAGHLRVREPVEVHAAERGVGRQQRDVGQRLELDETLQLLREERDRGAVIAEPEELHGRTVARRAGNRLVVALQQVDREARDRVRGPVADLERVERGRRHADPIEEVRPRHEALRFGDVLPHVARERDGALRIAGVEEHLDLDRREVLDLVERQVREPERLLLLRDERTHAELVRTQQERIVLGVELRRVVVVRLVAVEPRRERVLLAAHPVDVASERAVRHLRCGNRLP